eukprot:12675283-Heterocapsa_arctica.AAC.1
MIPRLQALPPKGNLDFPKWSSVQRMLARFETFFPAMENYDISGLMGAPEVVRYVSRKYFGDGGLTEERVQRCSAACAP